MASHWTRSHRSIGAELKFAGQQVSHAFLIHDQHHQINRLPTNLQTQAAARNCEKRGCAPTFRITAAGHTTAVTRANNESTLEHRGNDSNTLGGT